MSGTYCVGSPIPLVPFALCPSLTCDANRPLEGFLSSKLSPSSASNAERSSADPDQDQEGGQHEGEGQGAVDAEGELGSGHDRSDSISPPPLPPGWEPNADAHTPTAARADTDACSHAATDSSVGSKRRSPQSATHTPTAASQSAANCKKTALPTSSSTRTVRTYRSRGIPFPIFRFSGAAVHVVELAVCQR